MNKDYYCVIMAGGVGARFWPLSRNSRPKQFIDILGTGETLIQQTFRRLTTICPPENIFVVTHQQYFDQVVEQLPAIVPEHVLCVSRCAVIPLRVLPMLRTKYIN